MNNRYTLAKVAEAAALRPFHGYVMSLKSNLVPIISPFPKWSLRKADKKWCAAFIYYCCIKAGYNLPVKHPHPNITCNFAGCFAWEQWAELKENNFFHKAKNSSFKPDKGDIVLYNRVFDPGPHDHIGIILENMGNDLIVAEGNVNNLSVVLTRPVNSHVRGYIRIPDNWK